MKIQFISLIVCMLSAPGTILAQDGQTRWIRINQLGYSIKMPKVAVMCAMDTAAGEEFELIEAKQSKGVLKGKAGKNIFSTWLDVAA